MGTFSVPSKTTPSLSVLEKKVVLSCFCCLHLLKKDKMLTGDQRFCLFSLVVQGKMPNFAVY